jgi:ankyrin repeat protein
MSRFFSPVKAANFQEVKRWVESGNDINKKDDDNKTALYYAASFGLIEIVKYLVEHGADINCKNWQNETALHRASKDGSLEMVKYLVEHGADVNIKNLKGKTALHRAAKYSSFEMVKYLVEQGAKINCKNWKKNTVLHRVCKSRSLVMVKYLVEHGADINCENKQYKTPLNRAVESGSLELVKCLVEIGSKMKEHGAKTALYNRACQLGNELIIHYLLQHSTIKDIVDNDPMGRSFFSIACYEGSTALVQSLLKFNIDIREEKELICGNDEIAYILNMELKKSIKHQEKIQILKAVDDEKLTKVIHFIIYENRDLHAVEW